MYSSHANYKTAALTGFLWGLLEGLFFFIVPDPLLCFWALKSWRHAAASLAGVLLGTVLSAWIIYVALRSNAMMYLQFQKFWGALPGFHPKMLEIVAGFFHGNGARGILLGTSSGIPFRAFILEAWKQDIRLLDLLFWIPLARGMRIIIAPIATWGLRKGMHWFWVQRFKKMDESLLRVALVLSVLSYWIAIYVWYWVIFIPTTYAA